MDVTTGPLATLQATAEIYGRRYPAGRVLSLTPTRATVQLRLRSGKVITRELPLGSHPTQARSHVVSVTHGSGVKVVFSACGDRKIVMHSVLIDPRAATISARPGEGFADHLLPFLQSHQRAMHGTPRYSYPSRP